jgi:EAL domain-containing protein (putative c-di-GMP-specific phosphodiesterase class I)
MDMGFVQGIENSEKDQAIARLIITLAKSLGLVVVAEGVETQAQNHFLKDNGCDEVQGYYYYRPLPKEDVEGLLKSLSDSN